jgi:microcystin-dependent protein
VILGDYVTLDTITSNTEQMVITNAGTGPALVVTQTGPQPIADFYDDGGALAMRIADGGNVGIGTKTPLQKLHVQGAVQAHTQFLGQPSDSVTAPSFSWATDTNTGLYLPAVDEIGIVTAGTERARVIANGNVGIGTANPLGKLDVAGSVIATNIQIGTVTNAFVPRGIIVMWSGSIVTIPTGWAICDGTNTTPDLRNRFIVGAGSTYAVAGTGGSTTKTLTEANMPAHSHGGTTVGGGGHSHTVSAIYNTGGPYNGLVLGQLNGWYGTATTNQGTSTEPNHTHTFTTDTKGSGTSFDIMPPYYALAYIMKL